MTNKERLAFLMLQAENALLKHKVTADEINALKKVIETENEQEQEKAAAVKKEKAAA